MRVNFRQFDTFLRKSVVELYLTEKMPPIIRSEMEGSFLNSSSMTDSELAQAYLDKFHSV